MAGTGTKLLGSVGALTSITAGAGAYFAHSIVYPRRTSLEDERKWESEHGLWGEYDQIPRRNYTVTGKGGYVLHCEYANAHPGSRKLVILSHGYTSNRYGDVKYLGAYVRLGYNCILYDCRGHGENEKAPVSLGNLESEDLLLVIEDAYRRFGADIELGLHGESMGSSISLSVLRHHPEVRFVVADCGFACLYDLIKYQYGLRHLSFLAEPVNFMMERLYHFNMKQTSAREALHGNKVPICLIHGAADTFILPENSDELAKATSGYREVHKVEGAGHAESRFVLGEERYTQIVKAFLENISEERL